MTSGSRLPGDAFSAFGDSGYPRNSHCRAGSSGLGVGFVRARRRARPGLGVGLGIGLLVRFVLIRLLLPQLPLIRAGHDAGEVMQALGKLKQVGGRDVMIERGELHGGGVGELVAELVHQPRERPQRVVFDSGAPTLADSQSRFLRSGTPFNHVRTCCLLSRSVLKLDLMLLSISLPSRAV
jgi:hypothetical protein